jgi:pilus assembly protein Flp/PilA
MLANLIVYLMSFLPQDEEGQGMAEYGLILVLVALVVAIGLTLLGTNLQTFFNDLAAEF